MEALEEEKLFERCGAGLLSSSPRLAALERGLSRRAKERVMKMRHDRTLVRGVFSWLRWPGRLMASVSPLGEVTLIRACGCGMRRDGGGQGVGSLLVDVISGQGQSEVA